MPLIESEVLTNAQQKLGEDVNKLAIKNTFRYGGCDVCEDAVTRLFMGIAALECDTSDTYTEAQKNCVMAKINKFVC